MAMVTVGGVLFATMFVWTNGDSSVPGTVVEDSSILHVTIDALTFHVESVGDASLSTGSE